MLLPVAREKLLQAAWSDTRPGGKRREADKV